MTTRSFGRSAGQLRPVAITRGFTRNAHGSVLVEFGHTRVLCTAMFQPGVPPFKVGSGTGWLTAEYGMLPGSTPVRKERKADGRSTEIQRLIGRSLRAVVKLEDFGENTVFVDCDVLQADGGTRTAAITGAYVAVADALEVARRAGKLTAPGLTGSVSAVSVGVVGNEVLLDLDYDEDVKADVDMNVAMTGDGRFIEVQGTGERRTFSADELGALLGLARRGCVELARIQAEALAGTPAAGPLAGRTTTEVRP